MKQIGGRRRKLSKRKDPEASVDFYIERATRRPRCCTTCAGWPTGGWPRCRWPRRWPRRSGSSECGTAGPLVDLVKLEDISADYIATLSGAAGPGRGQRWARTLRPRAGRGAGGRAGPGAARPRRRAGGRRQPPQGPAQVVGLPRGLRLLLPAALRAGHRPRGRPVRQPEPGPGRGARGGPGLRRGLPAAHGRNHLVRPDPPAGGRARVRAQPQGVQAGPGRLPGLHPRGVPGHPDAADRVSTQPRPARGGPRARHREVLRRVRAVSAA